MARRIGRREGAGGGGGDGGGGREREKVEAWLKARRVLAMADDFQLLLSPSREWKMENPDAAPGYMDARVHMHAWGLNSFTLKVSREPAGTLSTRVYCLLYLLFIPGAVVTADEIASAPQRDRPRGTPANAARRGAPRDHRWRFRGFRADGGLNAMGREPLAGPTSPGRF